jgi:peptide/nickel transport system permease protein
MSIETPGVDARTVPADGRPGAAAARRWTLIPTPTRLRARSSARKPRRFGFIHLCCLAWLVLIVLAAIFADLLPIDDPAAVSDQSALAPGLRWPEPLGTDQLGRSQLARAIVGARASLSVALIATAIALVAGLLIGLVVGYLGKVANAVFDILTNIMLAFPPLILLIALAAALQPGLRTVVVSLGLLGIPMFARVARASTTSYLNREFVTAARAMGATGWRIIRLELLPNVVLPVSAVALVVAASFIVAEGSISFLGLGIPPPTPSWGGMISDGRDNLARYPHLVFVPAAFFFLTVYSFNTLGEWLQGKLGGKESVL